MGPSSATIVGLERSLHGFLESLRKVRPLMLPDGVLIVKVDRFLAPFSASWRAMVETSRGANFLPDTELVFPGSLVDPVTHFLTMRFGF